jgi:xylulose-5-phosphate/fructose-6-phosphate phosphoketolase
MSCPSNIKLIQIFLRGNGLLREPLKQEHVKRRLLGHWGTCPGLTFAYAHTNYLISKHQEEKDCPEFIFLTGVSIRSTDLTNSPAMELLACWDVCLWRGV